MNEVNHNKVKEINGAGESKSTTHLRLGCYELDSPSHNSQAPIMHANWKQLDSLKYLKLERTGPNTSYLLSSTGKNVFSCKIAKLFSF